MVDLYDLTWSEAADGVIEDVAKRIGITKKQATILVKNTLIYNCVAEEIAGQAEFLHREAISE